MPGVFLLAVNYKQIVIATQNYKSVSFFARLFLKKIIWISILDQHSGSLHKYHE
jgi:hypothetical protein